MVKKVTMQQIADKVGVSKFAVSQALSGKPGISSETREKIMQTASMLGYFAQKHTRGKQRQLTETVKPAASVAAGGRTTVVVLVPNIRFQSKESNFWGLILEGISQELEARGLRPMMVTDYDPELFLQIINPDAILGLIGVGEVSSRLLLEIRKAHIPFLLVDHEDLLTPCDTIFMDNFDCTRRMTHYLLGLGHRRLQFVGDISYSRSFFDRWRGFRAALEEHRVPLEQSEPLLDTKDEPFYHEHVAELLKPLLTGDRKATALVCANDVIAIKVMRALAKLQVSVPEDCSVTGFDNIEDSVRHRPSISTVNVAKQQMGKRAVERLWNRICRPDDPLEKLLIVGDFLVRESIGPGTEH